MAGQVVYVQQPSFGETLKNSTKTVTASGTAVQLSATSVPCIEVSIQPKISNTGEIWVGGSTVLATGANGGNVLLPVAAGVQPPSILLSAQNLNEIWIDADVNGEGVTFLYW